MDPMRVAWQARTPRERSALALGAVVVVALLLYSFLWEPMRAEHRRLREYLPQLRAKAAQFTRDAAEAQRLRGAGQAPSRSESARASLEAVAERTSVRANITSITEVSDGRVQVALEAPPYEAFVRWVGALAGSAGFTVESVQLRPGPAPGIVSVETLVLKKAGAP